MEPSDEEFEEDRGKSLRNGTECLDQAPRKKSLPDKDDGAHLQPISRENFFSAFSSDTVVLTLLTIIAAVTRLWHLGHPHTALKSEESFSQSVEDYRTGTFHFGRDPPFPQQLTSYLAGTDEDDFDDDLENGVSLACLRFLPALFGTVSVPISYLIMKDIGCSRLAAGFVVLAFLLEPAFIIASRVAAAESFGRFFAMLSVFLLLRFVKEKRSDSMGASVYSTLIGLSLGLAISSTYASICTLLLCVWIAFRSVWKVVGNLSLTWWQIFGYIRLCINAVIFLPLAVYICCITFHIIWLPFAGMNHLPGLSLAFESTLEGGMDVVASSQPDYVAYGSLVSLRNVMGAPDRPCWVHSHKMAYPKTYGDDGRRSSNQQQVTGFAFKDVLNWWVIKDPNAEETALDDPPVGIQDGDIVQLMHGLTNRLLNSYEVIQAPMSPECQEICAYTDTPHPQQNRWRIIFVHDYEPGTKLQNGIQFFLQHVPSAGLLTLTKKKLPHWALEHWEVAACHPGEEPTNASEWTIDEHRYPEWHRKTNTQEREWEIRGQEFLPEGPSRLSLWNKFLHLHRAVLSLKDANTQGDVATPMQWLTGRTVAMVWGKPKSKRQIALLSGSLVWRCGSAAILTAPVILVILWLWRARYPLSSPIPEKEWSRIAFTAEVFLVGFFLNFLPYFVTEEPLFLHEYLPALGFAIFLAGALLGEIVDQTLPKSTAQLVGLSFWAAWAAVLFYNFQQSFSLTYGMSDAIICPDQMPIHTASKEMAFLFRRRQPDACHCARLRAEKDVLLEELSKATRQVGHFEGIVLQLDRKLDDLRSPTVPLSTMRDNSLAQAMNAPIGMAKPPHVAVEEASCLSFARGDEPDVVAEYLSEARDEWDIDDSDSDEEEREYPPFELAHSLKRNSHERSAVKTDQEQEQEQEPKQPAKLAVVEQHDFGSQCDHSDFPYIPVNTNYSSKNAWILEDDDGDASDEGGKDDVPTLDRTASSLLGLNINGDTNTAITTADVTRLIQNATQLAQERQIPADALALAKTKLTEELTEENSLLQANLLEIADKLTTRNNELTTVSEALEALRANMEKMQQQYLRMQQPPTQVEAKDSIATRGSQYKSPTDLALQDSILTVENVSISSEIKSNLIRIRLSSERQQYAHEKAMLTDALEKTLRENVTLNESLESLRQDKDQIEELFIQTNRQQKEAETKLRSLRMNYSPSQVIDVRMSETFESGLRSNASGAMTVVETQHLPPDKQRSSGVAHYLKTTFRWPAQNPDKRDKFQARKHLKKLVGRSQRDKYRLFKKKKSVFNVVTLI
ncbi:Protein O-mannosyl-transferase 1 [Hypsibius exemplaris]|uniref:Protein O-mannosyl-transferase 2 n=1 Tax=Hypsibius exemplaris TaxID=2072580 RepID=A0A1W0X509_HYPEX|nr:Protein O-mannosyl-transferase 1 [Hypsibius exemplaris]